MKLRRNKQKVEKKKDVKSVIRAVGEVDFIPHRVPAHDNDTPQHLGIARDGSFKNYCATLWGAGHPSTGLGAESQRSQIEDFGLFLDYFAEPDVPIDHIAWRTQTVIGDHFNPDLLVQKLRQKSGQTGPISPGLQNVLERTDGSAKQVVRQDTSITLVFHAPSHPGRIQRAGSAEAVLAQEVWDFYDRAIGVDTGRSPLGLVSLRPLRYNDLLLDFLMALDPVFGQGMLQDWGGLANGGLLPESMAWPNYANTREEDFCRFGETFHIGYYVDQFPESGMFSDQFWNIIDLQVPKTVSTVVRMVPHATAQTQAEWRTTGMSSHNVERLSSQYRITEADRVLQDQATQEEKELAERLGEAGDTRVYIDLTGSSLEEVQESARRLRSVSMGYSFVVKPLTGRHHFAAIAALPLGRGLEQLVRHRSFLGL